jgi:hypothetical protein
MPVNSDIFRFCFRLETSISLRQLALDIFPNVYDSAVGAGLAQAV